MSTERVALCVTTQYTLFACRKRLNACVKLVSYQGSTCWGNTAWHKYSVLLYECTHCMYSLQYRYSFVQVSRQPSGQRGAAHFYICIGGGPRNYAWILPYMDPMQGLMHSCSQTLPDLAAQAARLVGYLRNCHAAKPGRRLEPCLGQLSVFQALRDQRSIELELIIWPDRPGDEFLVPSPAAAVAACPTTTTTTT